MVYYLFGIREFEGDVKCYTIYFAIFYGDIATTPLHNLP